MQWKGKTVGVCMNTVKKEKYKTKSKGGLS